MRNHTGDKPYKCDTCDAEYAQKASLNVHILTHTGEKPYKCNRCNAKFTEKGSLKLHSRTHTGEKPYKCEICGDKFTQMCSLRGHLRTHTGDKPYKCGICDAEFAHNRSLKSHTRIHTGEKIFYKDDKSGAQFAEICSLKTRPHIRVKPDKCGLHGVKYSRKLLLTTCTDNEEILYRCGSCGEQFHQKALLKLHFRNHTGEKPYKCDRCDTEFAHKHSLKSHIRIHAGENMFYKYDNSGEQFAQMCSLNARLRIGGKVDETCGMFSHRLLVKKTHQTFPHTG